MLRKTFNEILVNSLLASVANYFVWFALTFWVFIETRSILATSLIAGVFALAGAISSIFFGAIVDHNKKRSVMLLSSLVSLAFYSIGAVIYFSAPNGVFQNPSSIYLWCFIVVMMLGCIAGNIRNIALTTLVTIFFEEDERPKINGLVGMVAGVSFMATSVLSGLGIGFLGMGISVICALATTLLVLIHITLISFGDKDIVYAQKDESTSKIDIRGTLSLLRETPGIMALILFTSFNNFLGGVFMALMDSYGLSNMSVKAWGLWLALLSTGFIFGGILVSKYGLGRSPVKTLFYVNCITWTVTIFFTISTFVYLFLFGIFVWMLLAPIAEASESTILQKIIPLERQGRTIGFAQTIEQMASPITAFLIGPLTHFFFIPFMTDGYGAQTIGIWFGTGQVRAMALVFTLTGLIGLVATLIAMRSKPAKAIEKQYQLSL